MNINIHLYDKIISVDDPLKNFFNSSNIED